MNVDRLAEAIASDESLLRPQGDFGWREFTWRKWLTCDAGLQAIDRLKGTSVADSRGFLTVNRSQVMELTGDENPSTDPVAAYTWSQVWGHGKTGYGAYRTAVTLGLASPRSRAIPTIDYSEATRRLACIADTYLKDGAVRAYERAVDSGDLTIPYLGPAFGTKYLFFLESSDPPYRPLVLDELVGAALHKHADDTFPADTGTFPSTRLYSKYLDAVETLRVHDSLATRPVEERARERIETALFRIGESLKGTANVDKSRG